MLPPPNCVDLSLSFFLFLSPKVHLLLLLMQIYDVLVLVCLQVTLKLNMNIFRLFFNIMILLINSSTKELNIQEQRMTYQKSCFKIKTR